MGLVKEGPLPAAPHGPMPAVMGAMILPALAAEPYTRMGPDASLPDFSIRLVFVFDRIAEHQEAK